MSRQFWIFRVSGGDPFKVQVKGNPPMRHDGGAESVLRTLCTEEQAQALKREMANHGCRVWAHSPVETDAQKRERANVLSLLGGDRPLPCVRCPECAWFDPLLESLCGAGRGQGDGWSPEALEAVAGIAKYEVDLGLCPLGETPR